MTGDGCIMCSNCRMVGAGTVTVLLLTLISDATWFQNDSLLPSVLSSHIVPIGFFLYILGLVLITCSPMKSSDLHTQEALAPSTVLSEEGVSEEEPGQPSVPDWVDIGFDTSFDWEVLDVVGDPAAGQISLAEINKQYYTHLVIQWYQRRSEAEEASRRQLEQLKSETDFQVTEEGDIDIIGHRAKSIGGSHAYSANDIGYTVLNRMLVFDCEMSGRFYYVFIAASAYAKEIAEDLMQKAMYSFSCHPGTA